jgi:hypothetical protein
MRDTIDTAREVKMPYDFVTGEPIYIEKLKAFEALVRADERNRTWTQEHWTEYERSIAATEREACANVCEELPAPDIYSDTDKSMWDVTCMDCAAAIRARSKDEK